VLIFGQCEGLELNKSSHCKIDELPSYVRLTNILDSAENNLAEKLCTGVL